MWRRWPRTPLPKPKSAPASSKHPCKPTIGLIPISGMECIQWLLSSLSRTFLTGEGKISVLGVSADSPLKRSLSAGKIMGGRICGGLGFGGNVSRWNLRCWVDRCLNVFQIIDPPAMIVYRYVYFYSVYSFAVNKCVIGKNESHKMGLGYE